MPQADMGADGKATRRSLLRWGSWFFIANAGLMALIGLRYLSHFPLPDAPVALVYVVAAYLGHFALLGYLPFLLVLAPLVLLWPRPSVVRSVAVVLAAAMLSLLLVDTLVFAENRFHLNPLTLTILGTKTWAFGFLYLTIFLVLELLLTRGIGRRPASPGRARRGPMLAAALAGCLLLAQGLHVWADARYYVPITSFTPYLPLYQPLTAKGTLARYGWLDVAESRQRDKLARLGGSGGHRLDYPKAPLHCSPGGRPHNLLVILVDAMRWDSLRPALTPDMSALAEHASVMERHYSGGNSSRIGVFSLFYGLPGTYWQDFNAVQQPPVLMEQLAARGYSFGIFASKPLYRPTSLDRTVFANVADLPKAPQHAEDYDRDRAITRRWQRWLDNRDRSRPFFGFLFYDSLNHQDYPPGHPRTAPVPEDLSGLDRRRAEYRNSLRFVDSLVGRVLTDLRGRGLMDQTVVLITADHGQAFDDTGLGYAGYGSSFSDYQLRVPMVVHWPGRPGRSVTRRTAHRDVPATLLSDLLGCENPPSDYGSGTGLFDGQPWQWLVAGSYSQYAVVEPKRVTVVRPSGYLEIRGEDYRLLKHARVHQDVVSAALREMSRFYQ